MIFTPRSLAQSALRSRNRPHGFPWRVVLSRASLAVEGTSRFWARKFLIPMIRSTFFTPAGHRRLHVLQVVHAQSSGRLNNGMGSVKTVCLTSLLIFRGDLNLTGHPPVHVPHCRHRSR